MRSIAFRVVGCLGLAGLVSCSGGSMQSAAVATTPATTTVTVNGVTVPTPTEIQAIANLGASIVCGVGASTATHANAILLDTAIGAPYNLDCVSGDQAADTARTEAYPKTVPTATGHQLYTVLIGTNDANNCGPSAGCLANWQNALEASLTWLALPASDKIVASAAAGQTGGWATDNATGVAGLSTTANGATLSFTVNQEVSGRHLYVAYRVFDSSTANPGTAAVTVDGAVVGTLSSAPGTGHAIATGNGATDTIFVSSLPLGAAGSHVVKVITTTGNGGVFALQWVGVASATYFASATSVGAGSHAAPRVIVGQITQSTSATLNATVATYNATLPALVSALEADGMNVVIAPTGSVLNIQTEMYDELHPNDAGHLILAQTFAGVL